LVDAWFFNIENWKIRIIDNKPIKLMGWNQEEYISKRGHSDSVWYISYKSKFKSKIIFKKDEDYNYIYNILKTLYSFWYIENLIHISSMKNNIEKQKLTCISSIEYGYKLENISIKEVEKQTQNQFPKNWYSSLSDFLHNEKNKDELLFFERFVLDDLWITIFPESYPPIQKEEFIYNTYNYWEISKIKKEAEKKREKIEKSI